MKKLVVPFSGEFFDLTLTSYNNIFGRDKIVYALQYGIETPLQKYINELEEIGRTTNDDKSDKRKSRLNFLKICEENQYLSYYFQLLLGWLNGGGDNKWGRFIPGQFSSGQYNNQNLIITLAGGNIYNIFARLLDNIKWATKQPAKTIGHVYNNLTKTNRDLLDEYENRADVNLTKTNRDLLDEFENRPDVNLTKYVLLEQIRLLLQDNTTLSKSIDIMFKVSGNYSDFDFNLLPNKKPTLEQYEIGNLIKKLDDKIYNIEEKKNESMFKKLESGKEIKPEYSNNRGFALFRIKSYIACTTETSVNEKVNEKTLKDNCKKALQEGIIDKDFYNRLIPQLINKNDSEKINSKSQDWNECLNFVKILQYKKSTIKEATMFNIITVINYFKDYLQKNLTPLYKGPNDWDLEAIIFYINYTTYQLNNYIKIWEQGKLTTIFPPSIKDTHEKICDSFLSLNTIVTSSYLLGLSSSMIEYFLQNPDPLSKPYNLSITEKILDKLIIDIKSEGKCNDAKQFPAKITLVASSDNYNFNPNIKKYMMKGLQDARYSELSFPDGINIVLNAIVTKNSYDLHTLDLDNLYNDIILENALEGLNLETVSDYDLPHKKSTTYIGGKNNKNNKNKKNKKSKKYKMTNKNNMTIKNKKNRKNKTNNMTNNMTNKNNKNKTNKNNKNKKSNKK